MISLSNDKTPTPEIFEKYQTPSRVLVLILNIKITACWIYEIIRAFCKRTCDKSINYIILIFKI